VRRTVDVVYGAKVLVEDGAPVRTNNPARMDPYTFSILTKSADGALQSLQEGITCRSR